MAARNARAAAARLPAAAAARPSTSDDWYDQGAHRWAVRASLTTAVQSWLAAALEAAESARLESSPPTATTMMRAGTTGSAQAVHRRVSDRRSAVRAASRSAAAHAMPVMVTAGTSQ